jgi:hypothetical protein
MSTPRLRIALVVALGAGLATAAGPGCSDGHDVKSPARPATRSTSSSGGAGGGVGSQSTCGPTSEGQGGGLVVPIGSDDPKTCDEAAKNKAYVGCDFWPTQTSNPVWSVFDFAAVVANAGGEVAKVVVTRGAKTVASVEVEPNALSTIYLPWVPELKGGDCSACGESVPLTASVRSKGGAYHLVSSVPVTVYQFNALEYRGAGGPKGKDWSTCPGYQTCEAAGAPIGCFSFSNDASLLLPSTALTGNYRVTGQADWAAASTPAYIAVTGTQPDTKVTVHLTKQATVVAGPDVVPGAKGGTATYTIGAGDVIELVSDGGSDLTGTLVQASAPVQVVSGMPCVFQPFDEKKPACDHLEETVLPAETLGRHYFVTVPTAPQGDVVGHIVRLVGNVDGTALSYPSGHAPKGAPASIDAGQVVDLGVVEDDFEVIGDHELAIATFMLGASSLDPNVNPPLGDPSESTATALEQYRTKYVFLAPTDYEVSFVDVVQPLDAVVVLDGATLCGLLTEIGSGYGIRRVKLPPVGTGTHVLTATKPVGIQVIGYGAYTSYQYPGGLDLKVIADPPVPK